MIPSHQERDRSALEPRMGMQSTGERMPRESPELTTSQSRRSRDHQPHFVIYSLCLATGLEVIPEAREKGLHEIPGNARSTSCSPRSTCQREPSQHGPGSWQGLARQSWPSSPLLQDGTAAAPALPGALLAAHARGSGAAPAGNAPTLLSQPQLGGHRWDWGAPSGPRHLR